MNFKELYEGATPKLPGAVKGVQIMTPQQFVAKSAAGEEPEPDEELDENLHKWFKEKWVRFGPDGKIRGDCARGDDSEGKPKCLPQSKAHSLGKKGRASAAARKRREDPNPERSGKAINVATKKKTDEDSCPHCGGPLFEFSLMNEKKDACYYKVKSRYKVWPSAYASGALVKCRKKGAKNWGTKSESVEEDLSRRGFLKGMGAAALGTAGVAQAQSGLKPLTPGVERGHIEGIPAIKYQDKVYRFAKGKQGPKDGVVLTVPAGSIGIRGGHSVDVILGQDGFYYVYRQDVDEDLSRRGFLKGAGSAAALAATGARAQSNDERRAEELRKQNLDRIRGMAGTGSSNATQGPSGGYPGQIRSHIKSNLNYIPPSDAPKNPRVEYEVNLDNEGNVLSVKITKPSGVDAWDQANVKAIQHGGKFPKDSDGRVPPKLIISNQPLNESKKSNINEATKLPAPTRPIGDPELTDYLDRIRTQQKLKTDKYKLPYIHRSSVIGYYNEEGKKYNVDAIKQALAERPKKLLKQNEKMKHSNGELEQFYNIGFAALTGIALDEETNELIIVNTCPGAGSCKVDCFAMKGGKVQFQGPWLSDGRILTYLLNDPEGFFSQLDSEIKKEEKKGDKGGYSVSIRWHDAGDFFSPEYVDMAFKLAESNPDVSFYAYTKVSDVAMGDKPGNFMINWSEGASSREEKKVKAADPSLTKTKNSRIVPSDLFYDLLVKDEKKNLVKGPEGQWQVIPDKLPELKQRLAKAYQLSPNSILSYSEWENKFKGKEGSPLQYNVIITPGEPDLTAKDPGVLSTLLLKH